MQGAAQREPAPSAPRDDTHLLDLDRSSDGAARRVLEVGEPVVVVVEAVAADLRGEGDGAGRRRWGGGGRGGRRDGARGRGGDRGGGGRRGRQAWRRGGGPCATWPRLERCRPR